MLLSFVVPAYNEEAYLGACLESILNQTRSLFATDEISVLPVIQGFTKDHFRIGRLLVNQPRSLSVRGVHEGRSARDGDGSPR